VNYLLDIITSALCKRLTFKGGGLRFAMGSKSLFEPEERV